MEAMTSMPSSSIGQNQQLSKELNQHVITFEQCFIALKDEQVVARAIVFEQVRFLGYVTIEDMTKEETIWFIKNIISRLDKNVEWRTDLYSDKVHFDTIYDALHHVFRKEIQRKSFVLDTYNTPLSHHNFKAVDQVNKEDLRSLIMDVTETTLDTLIQYEVRKQGLHVYCENFLQEIMNDPEVHSLFHILYIDNEPVGFSCINRLLDTVGGIGYIGVKQAYQGHHYSTIILQKAIHTAYHHQIYKLIGDIDERNDAMCYNLLQTGFHEDCKQTIFLLK